MVHNGPKIVAIDDNKDNLVSLKAFIQDAFPDATIFSALNGREGIDLALLHNPDVILLDILMPGMDGFEVCRQLKKDPRLEHVPVVFLTALKEDRTNRIRALEAGGEGFISKPFDEAELTAQVRAMVKIKAANERERKEKEDLADLVAVRTALLEKELSERKVAEERLLEANRALEQNKRAMLNLLQDLNEEVTARKKSEMALRESEQFLDNIVEQIPDMIFLKSAEDLRFVRFNKAGEDLIGYSREEMLGKNDYDLFPKTNADFFTEKDREVLRTNQLTDIPEERIQTRNMGERILHTKKLPIVDDEGKPKYLLGISEDITERKRAEEKINLANRKLALMTDVTYQDIQNKVTALWGYVDISKKMVREEDRITLIKKEGEILETIHHLIKNTKDYQQMGVGQLRWIPIETAIRMQVEALSGKTDVSLDIDLHGLEINIDPLVDRVFYNLIDNAVKHGKTITRVSIRYQEIPDGIILICEDDGVGIPVEQKARIFDRVVGGGKFGLFFVSEFLSLSGMTITETGEPGRGARFEIAVPKGMYRINTSPGSSLIL